ncbi:MAG: DNA polymerase III subunit gamma/tau [Oscillospiraceae bacterium]|nr:DNA polymerase III subunit gamma/tau [Oscillospiraceae bacterium]
MYQALYRKWRPKTFDEVIGQEHITETLKTQVRSGHLSHAYIFIGTRGTGKTTCARILAKAVNCENPVNGNPCNQCRYCRGIDDGSILDVVELDAASNTGVDNVRDLREEAVFTPAVAKKRVYIIDEVHMLSLAAFNALLKIIEEPPAHLMFILATTELQKVPATILSRCQRHSFRRIPTQQLADYLMHIAARENLKLEEEAARQIGRLADGGVRDALSILDQCSGRGSITTETVFETMGLAGNRNLLLILERILQNDTSGALQMFQKIWLDGKEPASFLGEMSGLLRDILIVKAAPAGAGELISGNFEREVLDRFAAQMTKEELLFCMDAMLEASGRIRQVRNPRMVAEVCLVSLCDKRNAESISAVRARLSRLEETVQKGIAIPAEAKQEKADFAAPHSVPDRPDEAAESRIPAISRDRRPAPTAIEETAAPAAVPAREAVQAAPAPEPEPEPGAKENKEDTEDHVAKILKTARDRLPRELRSFVEDDTRLRARLEGQDLILEALPGFLLDRLKRPEVRDIFGTAAKEVLQTPVAVRISERKQDQREKRDLNELRQFKEVTFK